MFEDSTVGELVLETAGGRQRQPGGVPGSKRGARMAGASQLKINLNGGSLTGRVRGVGNIRYTGAASSVELDTVAQVKVSRR